MSDRTALNQTQARRAQTTSKARLQAEIDFLLARAANANSCRFDDPKRWTGRSSNALVRFVFGGDAPAPDEFPRDPSDLAACYRTVARLPEHLKIHADAWMYPY